MYSISDSYCERTGASKPSLPYLAGRHLALRSHHPPVPTTGSRLLTFQLARERESIHPLDRCLRHPPLQGKDGQDTAEVQITRAIRAENNHCAQVVSIRVQSSSSDQLPKDRDLVAKIYDPLYFDHDQDDVDPFLYTEYAYTHETAAYGALSALQGGIIPKYFGSFSIELRARENPSRFVRLILVELIPGKTMLQLISANLSQPNRQSLMKAVIDAESLIYTHNIWHMDVRPSNILVCDSTKVGRVVIIDFGQCAVGRHPLPFLHQEYLPNVSISPLLRWREPRASFQAWIDWEWIPWLERVYASTRASITENMKSLWLPQEPEPPREPPTVDPSRIPKWVEDCGSLEVTEQIRPSTW